MNNKEIEQRINLLYDEIAECNQKYCSTKRKIRLLYDLKVFNIPSIFLGLCGIGFALLLFKINPADIGFTKEMMSVSAFLEALAIPYSITTTLIAKKYDKREQNEAEYLTHLYSELDENQNKLNKEISARKSLNNSKKENKRIITRSASLDRNYTLPNNSYVPSKKKVKKLSKYV